MQIIAYNAALQKILISLENFHQLTKMKENTSSMTKLTQKHNE